MAKPNKNNRLGRGLSALLKDEPTVKTAQDEGAKKLVGNILEVELEKITANPWQPRTNFDKKSLEELISSISTLGVIQPITVRKKQAEGDDIFTQYLAVREFKNLSNLIEKYQSTSIHDLSDGHIDTDDELEVTNEKSSEDYEHGKTSMLDDDFEMDDEHHEPELGF